MANTLKKLKMEFEKLKIDGLVLCKPKIIEDKRGFFSETFRKDLLEDFISDKLDFCQHNTSRSSFGVLRGLHFQTKPKAQTKLISVSNGEILDVVLDIRKDSPTYGKHYSVILNDINNFQLLVPRGFAHGFIALSELARVNYNVDNYYSSENEFGINPFDRDLKINWILEKNQIIINNKDKSNKNLSESPVYKF
tara:strand:- start:621 stop:1202 length:582 start_codon:yes stop_codon:yes gene_type:complete